MKFNINRKINLFKINSFLPIIILIFSFCLLLIGILYGFFGHQQKKSLQVKTRAEENQDSVNPDESSPQSPEQQNQSCNETKIYSTKDYPIPTALSTNEKIAQFKIFLYSLGWGTPDAKLDPLQDFLSNVNSNPQNGAAIYAAILGKNTGDKVPVPMKYPKEVVGRNSFDDLDKLTRSYMIDGNPLSVSSALTLKYAADQGVRFTENQISNAWLDEATAGELGLKWKTLINTPYFITLVNEEGTAFIKFPVQKSDIAVLQQAAAKLQRSYAEINQVPIEQAANDFIWKKVTFQGGQNDALVMKNLGQSLTFLLNSQEISLYEAKDIYKDAYVAALRIFYSSNPRIIITDPHLLNIVAKKNPVLGKYVFSGFIDQSDPTPIVSSDELGFRYITRQFFDWGSERFHDLSSDELVLHAYDDVKLRDLISSYERAKINQFTVISFKRAPYRLVLLDGFMKDFSPGDIQKIRTAIYEGLDKGLDNITVQIADKSFNFNLRDFKPFKPINPDFLPPSLSRFLGGTGRFISFAGDVLVAANVYEGLMDRGFPTKPEYSGISGGIDLNNLFNKIIEIKYNTVNIDKNYTLWDYTIPDPLSPTGKQEIVNLSNFLQNNALKKDCTPFSAAEAEDLLYSIRQNMINMDSYPVKIVMNGLLNIPTGQSPVTLWASAQFDGNTRKLIFYLQKSDINTPEKPLLVLTSPGQIDSNKNSLNRGRPVSVNDKFWTKTDGDDLPVNLEFPGNLFSSVYPKIYNLYQIDTNGQKITSPSTNQRKSLSLEYIGLKSNP